MVFLRQSTASQEVPLGYFVDDANGNSEEVGLTILNTDIQLWKNGGTTLTAKSAGSATHISNGIYYAVLNATDSDTAGPMKLFVHVAGALPVVVSCTVLTANAYDTLFSTDYFDVNVVSQANIDFGALQKTSLSAATPALSAAGVDNILDEVIENSLTLRQAIMLIKSVCAGKSAGGGTASLTFRDDADTKNRVTATVDVNGNRSAVTKDVTP
jgi:hypothetical protein